MGKSILEMGAIAVLGIGILAATRYQFNDASEQTNPPTNRISLEERIDVTAENGRANAAIRQEDLLKLYKFSKMIPNLPDQGPALSINGRDPISNAYRIMKAKPKISKEELEKLILLSNADSRNFLSLDGIYPIVNRGSELARADCKEPIQTIDHKITPELGKIIRERVEESAKFLLGDKAHRDALKTSFERATEYRDYIEKASCISGLSESLIYGVITAESGANLRGISKSGAKGLVMFLEATAMEQGLKKNRYFDQRLDPEAIIAGAVYMRSLIDKHGLVKGIAAYNGGTGRVGKIITKYNGEAGINAFNDLPKETREYVIRVLTRSLIYGYRKELRLELEQRSLFSEVLANSIPHKVEYGQTLSTIAQKYRVPPRVLERLNSLISPHGIKAGDILNVPDPAIYSQPLNNSSLFRSH